VRNKWRDELRARDARPREAPEDHMGDAEPAEESQAIAALDARDARVVVRRLMDRALDETEKRVMTLHYGHEMRLDAITAALGLTNASGAKAYIVSAKRKLSVAVRRWNVKS
jgi:DNA-directed RNA polymerase specialized sigma24 family protein